MLADTSTDPMLEWALAYARAGYAVLPCHTIVEGHCTCGGCKKPGKHPRINNYDERATTHEAQIRAWWADWPGSNIAIGLKNSGVVSVAPDRPEFEDEFQARGLPLTFSFRSGGGLGTHHVYQLDGAPQTRECREDEYDILSLGIIVAPPSIHSSGNRYGLLDDDSHIIPVAALPACPEWAKAILWAKVEKKPSPTTLVDTSEPPVALQGRALELWSGTRSTKRLDGTVDRSSTFHALGKELATAGMTVSGIAGALKNRDQTLGYNKGEGRTDGDNWYWNTARKAFDETGRERQEYASLVESLPGDWKGSSTGSVGPKPQFDLLCINDEVNELDQLPTGEWLLHGLYKKNSVVAIIGESNVGKTVVGLDQVMSLVTDSDWREQALAENGGGDVVWIAGEGVDNLNDLIQGWRQANPDRRMRHKLLVLPHAVNFQEPGSIAGLIESIKAKADAPVLIAVDTLSKNFGPGDENNTGDMQKFVNLGCHKIREATGATVLIFHHTGWNTERERGNAVLRSDSETVWHLERAGEAGHLRMRNVKIKGRPMDDRLFRIDRRTGSRTRSGQELPEVFDYAVLIPVDEAAAAAARGPRMTGNQRAVFEAIARLRATAPPQRNQIAEESGVPHSSLTNALHRLVELSLIMRVEGGQYPTYDLTEAGVQADPMSRIRQGVAAGQVGE